jgi:glycosyltransferase involved in cell wall biosynthesis
LGYVKKSFICLFIFDFYSDVERKNPFTTIETFKKTFKNNEDSILIIKTHNGNKQEIENLFQFIGNDHRIKLINETYNSKNLNILMNACDVYISLHRSEGLGLTLKESILLEKPTLCTNYSGNVDFCLPEWSELVDYKLVPVNEKSLYKKIIVTKNEPIWADPNIDDAVDKLTKIYNNLSEYENKAKVGKKWILENYNYETFNNQINEILKNEFREF